MSVPASLKAVVPFVKRAEELEKENSSAESKIMAYYCRLHVVMKGSKIAGSPADPAVSIFLLSQMDILEKSKPQIGITTEEKGFEVCKTFALSLFKQADEEDRAGMADKGTAKLYYYTGTFLDVLEVFKGADVSDVAEAKKYAKWRATEILNAIKQGVQPDIGGFGEGLGDLSMEESASAPYVPPSSGGSPYSNPAFTLPVAPTQPAFVHYQQPLPQAPMQQLYGPPPQQAKYSSNVGVVSTAPPTNNLDPRVQDSIELVAFALAALKHNELPLARERLQEALRRLG